MQKYTFDIGLLLPKATDNAFRGVKIAQYAFYLLTAVTVVRSCLHIFLPDGGSQSIANIPLDSYAEAAADTVIYLFAVWGLSQLIIGILYITVALRYRSLIPLMYLLMIFEYGMRLAINHAKPIVTLATAPGAVANYVIIPLAFILLVLSLITEKRT